MTTNSQQGVSLQVGKVLWAVVTMLRSSLPLDLQSLYLTLAIHPSAVFPNNLCCRTNGGCNLLGMGPSQGDCIRHWFDNRGCSGILRSDVWRGSDRATEDQGARTTAASLLPPIKLFLLGGTPLVDCLLSITGPSCVCGCG